MTSSNTIAFGADTLDVDSVKVPGTMLVVRRALLAYEKKMQPGDHLVVCAEEVGKKGRNRVEVAVIHERADAVAAKAAIDRGDDVSAKIQRVAVPPKELVSMCAEIESAEVPQLEGEAEPAGELGTAAEDAPAPVVEAEPVVIELSPEEKRLNEVAAALGDAAHLAEYVVIALGKRSLAPFRTRTLGCRDEPDNTSKKLDDIPKDTQVRIIEERSMGDGRTWAQARHGWTPRETSR